MVKCTTLTCPTTGKLIGELIVNPCLIVMNVREIPHCLASIRSLSLDQAWFCGYTEEQLEDEIPEFVESSNYSHYILVSDDVYVPSSSVVSLILSASEQLPAETVITGYCNLDLGSRFTTLVSEPLADETPGKNSYKWVPWTELIGMDGYVEYIATYFAANCLTCIPREIFRQFPFQCYHSESGGFASDYHLSRRLSLAGIPILAPRNALCLHDKLKAGEGDPRPGYQPITGEGRRLEKVIR